MTTWFLIIDCNTFYASVEKVFRPDLRNKPVVVLSNNDGVVVALSQEAKDVGIKRGDLLFKIEELVKTHRVHVFSSNFVLYYDFSKRIETVVRRYFYDVEKYSVDEMFVEYTTDKSVDEIRETAKKIRDTISDEIKIKVSIGIAPTKTLAKVMNRYAKKDKRYQGVAILKDTNLLQKALFTYPAGDVWGIGRQHSKKLAAQGITTAWQFSQMNDNWLRKNFSIVGLRTARELRGIRCIDMELHPPDKKNILCSRSFGKPISELLDLKAAVSAFVQEVAEKLRRQKSVCKSIGVMVMTNPHRKDQKQYYNSVMLELPYAANDNLTLQEIAFIGLEKIFRTEHLYKKAGVFVNDLFSSENIQYTLWDNAAKISKRRHLFQTVDTINTSLGLIKLGIQKGTEAKHSMRQTKKSPNYTTDISQVPKIDMD